MPYAITSVPRIYLTNKCRYCCENFSKSERGKFISQRDKQGLFCQVECATLFAVLCASVPARAHGKPKRVNKRLERMLVRR